MGPVSHQVSDQWDGMNTRERPVHRIFYYIITMTLRLSGNVMNYSLTWMIYSLLFEKYVLPFLIPEQKCQWCVGSGLQMSGNVIPSVTGIADKLWEQLHINPKVP